jgi:hypothetical protein
MEQSLVEMVTRVLIAARRAGLSERDQQEAAVAAVWAAQPSEAPAMARLLVQMVYPEVGSADMGGAMAGGALGAA